MGCVKASSRESGENIRPINVKKKRLDCYFDFNFFFFNLVGAENSHWNLDVDERVNFGIDFGKKSGFIGTGDSVIAVTGWRQGSGSCNTVRIM